jgi:hypothetical protein
MDRQPAGSTEAKQKERKNQREEQFQERKVRLELIKSWEKMAKTYRLGT